MDINNLNGTYLYKDDKGQPKLIPIMNVVNEVKNVTTKDVAQAIYNEANKSTFTNFKKWLKETYNLKD